MNKNNLLKVTFLFILLITLGSLSFARQSTTKDTSTGTSADTSLDNKMVWIGGIPINVTDANNAQQKADWVYNFYMTTDMSTPEAAAAARAIIAEMIKNGYVPPDHRAGAKVASTVFQNGPAGTPDAKSSNFGPALTGDVSTGNSAAQKWSDSKEAAAISANATVAAAYSALTESAAKVTDQAAVLPKIDQALLNKIAEDAGVYDKISSKIDIASKAIAYVEAYNDFMESGGNAVDPATGALSKKYVVAMQAQTDYIAAFLPSYYGPVADALNDAGASVAAIQAGDLPSSAIGQVMFKGANKVTSLKTDAFTNKDSILVQTPIQTEPEKPKDPPCWGETAPGCTKRGVVTTKCPLTFIVTAPDGKRAGIDPKTNKVLEEILGSFVIAPEKYTVDPQIVYLPQLISGDYSIAMNGRGNGEYSLFYKTYDMENHILTSQKLKGKIHTGEVLSTTFNPNADSLAKDSGKIVFVKDVIYKYVLPAVGFVLIVLVVSFLAFRKKRK